MENNVRENSNKNIINNSNNNNSSNSSNNNSKNKNGALPKDITGMKFGRLTALEPTDKRSFTSIVWKCRCDCGNICYVSRGHLKSGNISSCGCIKREKADKLEGKKFGRLTVLEKLNTRKHGKVMWRCKCDCGNIIDVASDKLKRGYTSSCGCLKNYVGKINQLHQIDNSINHRLRKNNSSGVVGVCYIKSLNLWGASITFNRVTYNLGSYRRKEDAIIAREKAEKEIFEPFMKKNSINMTKNNNNNDVVDSEIETETEMKFERNKDKINEECEKKIKIKVKALRNQLKREIKERSAV